MASSFPSLPQLGPPPAQNAPGPYQGYNAPPTGAQPYPPSTGANLLQGVTAFVQQFQAQRETDREHNAKLAQQSLQNMMLGLPVDMKKTAAYMKKAGMNIDFETPLAGGAPGGGPNPANQATPPSPQAPGGVPAPGQNLPPGPPPPNPNMPTSVWDRVKAAIGLTPPQINPNSAGMAGLQRIAQMGQTGMDQQVKKQQLEGGALDVQGKQQALILSGLQGNDGAWETLRASEGKSTPIDQIFSIGRKANIPEAAIGVAVLNKELGLGVNVTQQLEMAKSYAPHFGGDLSQAWKYVTDVINTGTSTLQPELSFEEKLKVADTANDVLKNRPTVPPNLAQAYAMATLTNKPYASQLGNMINGKDAKGSPNFPTELEVKNSEWSSDFKLNQQKFGESVTEFRKSYELDTIKALQAQFGDEFTREMHVIDDKNSSGSEVTAAKQRIADMSNTMKPIKLNGVPISPKITADRVGAWSNLWMGSETNLGTTANSDVATALNRAVAAPDHITDPSERAAYIQAIMPWLQNFLESRTSATGPGALGKGMGNRRLSTDEPLPGLPGMTPGTGPFALGGQQ